MGGAGSCTGWAMGIGTVIVGARKIDAVRPVGIGAGGTGRLLGAGCSAAAIACVTLRCVRIAGPIAKIACRDISCIGASPNSGGVREKQELTPIAVSHPQ